MTPEIFDVAVVGAGYSGATTARDLGDRGHSVVLLEATDRVGGRAWTRPFRGAPELAGQVEVGGMWVHLGLQPAVAAEVRRYGIELADSAELEPSRAVFMTGGERRRSPVPAAELAHLEAALLHLYDAARRVSTGEAVHRQALSDLDVSARDFFAPLNLPPTTRDVILAAIAAYAGVDPDAASMLHLVGKIAAYGCGPYAALFGGGPIGTTGEAMFRHGSTDLVRAMVEDSGAEVRMSSAVTRIEQDLERVRLSTDAGDIVEARACVVAVPGSALTGIDFRPVLSAAKSRVIADRHSGRAVKTLAIVEGLKDAPLCLGLGPLLCAVPLRRLGGDHILYAGFGADDLFHLDPTDRVQVESALRQYLPDARVVACDGHDWNADPYFRGAYQVDPPGRQRLVPLVMGEPEGRILFSGADLDDGIWRVSFESAIRTGHRAAEWATDLLRQGRRQP